jgi:hypothetical protein
VTGALGDTIYREVLAKLLEAGRTLQDVLNTLGEGVRQAIAQLPAIGAWLRTQWDRLLAEAGRAIDAISKLTSDIGGDPTAVRQLGEDWVNQIGAVASTQAQALGRGQLPSNGKWEGVAATAYFTGVVPNQTGALSAVKDATDSVNEGLNEVANAIESFWASIGVAVAAFLVALAAALVANATILGIPPGVLALILACIVFAAAVNAAFTSLGNSFDMVDRLFAAATNVQPVQAGWPPLQSTDTLSDASVKDGDASEWRPSA